MRRFSALILVILAALPASGLHNVNYYAVTVSQPAHGTIMSSGAVTIPNCEAVPEDPCSFSITADIMDGTYSIAGRNNTGNDGNCCKRIGAACNAIPGTAPSGIASTRCSCGT